jgi:uncharacterized repeat protein (TIGR03803 family)
MGDTYMPRKMFSLTTGVLTLAAMLVFSASLARAVDKETILHTFIFGSGDGVTPFAGLVADTAGNFYGTTAAGGSFNGGTVFELSPITGGSWTETVLFSFPAGTYPESPLIFDAAGNLYGTTLWGGAYGGGAVVELSPLPAGGWAEANIYSFNGYLKGEVNPYGGVMFDSTGNLYGVTGGGIYNFGTAYRLSKSNGTWTETAVYNFLDGFPYGTLILDAAGNLYGATIIGGGENAGTVFQLNYSSGTLWENTIYTFTGGNDGANPRAGLTIDASGNLYGTTNLGGAYGNGVVFKLSPTAHSGWHQGVLHAFAGGNDGANPQAAMIFDDSGNLYGTAAMGGAHGHGTVFKLTHGSKGGWIEGTLHSFTGGADGSGPLTSLTMDAAGNLYGTTGWGGNTAYCSSSGCGVVFELSPVTANIQ